MLRRTLLALSILLGFIACAKKAKTNRSGTYIPAILSENAVPAVARIPTNPNGGLVPGKGQPMDPEESVRRKTKNEVQPIVFGVSAGGISMSTTQSQARAILAQSLGVGGGLEVYPEHIRVSWGEGADPTPQLLVVDDGYGGRLDVPAPFGPLTAGQAMTSLLTTQADLKNLLLVTGAAFEKQPAGYNCETALTCRLTQDAEFFSLEYRRGGILIAKDANLSLQVIYFYPPKTFYARPTQAIVYGSSIAGVTFDSQRASVEARIGPPEGFQDGIFYYDQNSVGIAWGVNNSPDYMGVLGTYQGTMDFGTVFGVHKIGDSFKTYVTDDADGAKLMIALDRSINNRAADYTGCNAQATPVCSLTLDASGKFLVIRLDKGTFAFTNNAERQWILYEMLAP